MERTAIATLTCPACGAPARHGAAGCAYCGVAFRHERQQANPTAAAVRNADHSSTPDRIQRKRQVALAILALLGIGIAAWFPTTLPVSAAAALGQAHLLALAVGAIGWLGAETPRQVRPWSILLAFTFVATAIVIATRQTTGEALPTAEARFAHLAVLAAGIWLATVVWQQRRSSGPETARRVHGTAPAAATAP